MAPDRLTDWEIMRVVNSSYSGNLTPQIGFALYERSGMHPWLLQLKNHKVIEIGPGKYPMTNYYACDEYVSAEPGLGGMDGLSVLRKQADLSVIVVSFGVIDTGVIGFSGDPVMARRYMQELVGEIRRVANPFAMIVGNDANYFLGKPDFPLQLKAHHGIGGVYLPSSTQNSLPPPASSQTI